MTAIHTPQSFNFNQLQQSFSPSEHWIWSSSHPGLQMIKFSRFTKASEISNTVSHCPLSVTGKPFSVGYPVNAHQCGLLDPLVPHLPSHHMAITSVFTASSTLYADFLNLQLFLSVSSELNRYCSPLFTSPGKAITIHLVVSTRKTGIIRGWVLTLHRGSVIECRRCSGFWPHSFSIVSALVQAFLPSANDLFCFPISWVLL